MTSRRRTQQTSRATSSKWIKNEFHQFDSIAVIGNGGYGQVYKVRKMNGMDENELYALKEVVVDENESTDAIQKCEEKILNERKILELVLGFHFCTQMLYAFKIDHKHYFALEYHPRGDLRTYMRKYAVDYNTARLCAAEILLAIEYLHSKKVVYRDLKPENILIDSLGHMVLTDFGLSEQLTEKGSADGCSGTTEYMAPEAIRVSPGGYCHTVDFWSWGCVLYQMLTGRVPFEVDDELRDDIHEDEFLIWCILYTEPSYDYQNFRSHRFAQRFVEQLLEKTSNKRLGAGPDGIVNIKEHPFFDGVDWKYVYHKHYKVLGEQFAERKDNNENGTKKSFKKAFIRNGFDYVCEDLSHSANPQTMTSKLEKILGPNEWAFDALYEQQREPKIQMYSKQFDCHMHLPESKMKAVIERWTTMCPNE